MTNSRIWAVSYLILVVAIVALAGYARAVDHSTQDCVGRVVRLYTESQQARSEAAETRDAALVGSKRALRELIRLRVIEGVADSPEVQRSAKRYLAETQRFIDASAELDRARAANPLPDYRTFCHSSGTW